MLFFILSNGALAIYVVMMGNLEASEELAVTRVTIREHPTLATLQVKRGKGGGQKGKVGQASQGNPETCGDDDLTKAH